MNLELTREEVELVVSALDSHEYWQLSDQDFRHSGFVLGDGSEDEENVAEIQRCRALAEKLSELLTSSTDESRTSP